MLSMYKPLLSGGTMLNTPLSTHNKTLPKSAKSLKVRLILFKTTSEDFYGEQDYPSGLMHLKSSQDSQPILGQCPQVWKLNMLFKAAKK